MQTRSFIGLADCYLKPYNTAGSARELGSMSQLQLQYDEQQLEQVNYGREGGLANAVSRIRKIGFNATFQSISKENLALCLRGSTSAVVSGSVTDEEHVAYLGGLIRTAHPSPTSVVVTDNPMTETYVEGEDYKVTGAGIVPLPGGDISEEQDLLISYSYGAYDIVEALTSSQQEFTLFFDGLNEAEGGKNAVVDLWRLRFGTVQNFDLIGENYVNLQVSGFLLLDPTKTGVGTSKFFRWLYPSD